MSIKLMSLTFGARIGDPVTKIILLKLADNANDAGYCHPGIKTIAAEAEVSTRTVQRHLLQLSDKNGLNIISIQERHQNERQLSNGYLIDTDRLLELNRKMETPVKMGVSCCHGGVTQESWGGDTGVMGGGDTGVIQNHQLEPLKEKDKKEKKTDNSTKQPKREKAISLSLIKMCPDWVEKQDWEDLLLHRKAKRSAETPRAIQSLIGELDKARKLGFSISHCVDTCCNRNWTGFFADWMSNVQQPNAAAHREKEEPQYFYCVECRKDHANGGNCHERTDAMQSGCHSMEHVDDSIKKLQEQHVPMYRNGVIVHPDMVDTVVSWRKDHKSLWQDAA